MTSRLAGSTSTYLAQHADQPVDWWPWSPGAFAEARRRDVPVMLSIGYASCHWCHVMARESFADPDTARQLNEGFVAIKVDREERPDVDAVYMTATQALTGSGGWPMTCFLTPDAAPFYAGTYFPRAPTGGAPSFRQLLTAISQAWTGDRDAVLGGAAGIRESLAAMSGRLAAGTLGPAELAAAAEELLGEVDPVHGGFGGAPKFPPAMALEFLLRHHERTGAASALAAVDLTLDRMARGGIFDQLGGGFCRYSVDRAWHVPHFEKMLDDNAQLLRLYAHHHRLTGSALSARVASMVADFVLRELRLPSGAFAASLDADTEHEEGATYRWTGAQLVTQLGPALAAVAAEVFALPDPAADVSAATGPPADDPARQVLRLPMDPPEQDDPDGVFAAIRGTMLTARDLRPQPARDDIVVLRSNGLMIAALAEAGALLDRPDWIAAAHGAVDHLVRVHRVDGRWFRSSRGGRVGPARAVLADLGDLAGGLLALYQATGDSALLRQATDVVDAALAEFADRDDSGAITGFFDTAADAGTLILRPRDPTDGAAPSGLSALAHALITLAAITGQARYRAVAETVLASVAELAGRFPRSAGWHLAAAEALVAGPLEIAVAGPDGAARDALAAAARRLAPGGSVMEIGPPDAPGRPLLADRPPAGGAPTAFVCRGFVCDRPVTSVDELAALLGR
ncbi:MAG TPA: thioredoxin domain-containing protein [Nakamurella sp.]